MNKKLINLESCQNFSFQTFIFNISAVTCLTAAFCIERCFIQYNINVSVTLYCCKNFCITFIFCISNKLSRTYFIFNFSVFNITCNTDFCSCSFCSVFLLLHCSFIAFFIDFQTVFFSDFTCQFKREAKGIIQSKRTFTVNIFLICNEFVKHFVASVKSFCKTFFFFFNRINNFCLILNQIRISFAVMFNNSINKLIQERQVHSENFSVT